jgi:transcriptional regulator with XRE-family HTH domain
MRKNEYEKKIALKLKQIRESHHLSTVQMAAKLRIYLASYRRNEECTTTPGLSTLYNLGNDFNISLDWLVMDKGEMYYNEKVEEKKTEPVITGTPSLSTDMKELLDHMEKIPLLRFEMMSHFYKFKEEHSELVEKTMKSIPEEKVNP